VATVEHAARGSAATRLGAFRLSPRSLGLLLTVVTVVATVSALHAYVLAPLTGHLPGTFEDFSDYLGAAHAAGAGSDPYSGFSASAIVYHGFAYPPIAAWLLRPLALLPHRAAEVLWLWLGLASMVAGSVITARTLRPRSWPAVRLGLCAALLFVPATYNLSLGQANPVIFLLLALALRSWVRGDQGWCGSFLGVAAAIKIAPAALILLLLRRHWWRGAAVMAGVTGGMTLAGVVLLGPGATGKFVHSVLPALGRDDGWVDNQTWNGILSRLAEHATFAPAAGSMAIHVGALLLAAIGFVGTAWVVRPGERGRDVRGAEFGAGVVAMLLGGSVAWIAHDIHLLIPLFAGLGLVAARRGRPSRALIGALAAATLGTAVLAPALLEGSTTSALIAASRAPGWWLELQVWSVPALTAAALLVALAATVRRPAPRTLVRSA
jgi:alpha-1,2-mannosyltransferase